MAKSRKKLQHDAWKYGWLEYKLKDHQLPLYRSLISAIQNPDCLKYVVNSSRRFGKSFVLCLIACEFALREKNSYIRFAAPTSVQLREILHEHMKKICDDAPIKFKPQYKAHLHKYIFPSSGSEITFAGTDKGHAENLRGNSSNLNILDEAGSMDDLNYVMTDILMPQTLTTRGTTILASTPPRSPAHEFVQVALDCEYKGNYSKYTIDDNTSLTKQLIELYKEECGGEDSTTFQREYLCKFVVDSNLAVVPEWKDEYIKPITPDMYYPFYHKYLGMDYGNKDFTAIIFGYYDFKKATLFIQDEATVPVPVIHSNIRKVIKEKEELLWKDDKAFRRRIADNNEPIVTNSLCDEGLTIWPTNKDSLAAMTNELRELVLQGRLIVDPKCVKLIGCLQYAIWNKGSSNSKVYKEMARMSPYGHFDHLAALVYLVRNIDFNTNPIPETLGKNMYTHMIDDVEILSATGKAIKDLFQINTQ